MELFIDGANSYDSWYVVRSKPRMEQHAANMLKDQLGLVVFLPKGKVISHGNKVQFAPFFPGYLFIQAASENIHPGRINTCSGVLHLISFDGELESIPHKLFEVIYKNIDDFNREGRLLNEQYQPSDPIRMKEGPLKSLDMVFLGYCTPTYRVRALVSILGRLKEVQVDSRMLERMPCDKKQENTRFTRGRGRKIKSNTDYFHDNGTYQEV